MGLAQEISICKAGGRLPTSSEQSLMGKGRIRIRNVSWGVGHFIQKPLPIQKSVIRSSTEQLRPIMEAGSGWHLNGRPNYCTCHMGWVESSGSERGFAAFINCGPLDTLPLFLEKRHSPLPQLCGSWRCQIDTWGAGGRD